MDTPHAEKILLTTGVVVFGVTAIREVIGQEHFSMRPLIGSGVAYTVMAVVAQFLPDVAAGLGILAATSAVIVQGVPVFDYLNERTTVDGKPGTAAAGTVKNTAGQPSGIPATHRNTPSPGFDRPTTSTGKVLPL